jgi:hypothetical protein
MQRLRPLLFVYPPFDFLEDERVQDELIDGGVNDLMFVFGHLFDDRRSPAAPSLGGRKQGRFVRDYYATERRGELVPAAFRATPELYAGLGATPPELPPGMDVRSARMGTVIEQLASKGVRVCIFGYGGAGPDGPATWESEEASAAHRWDYVEARIRDFVLHFPALAGFVTDGPGFGYEITPGFTGGGPLSFAPLPTDAEARAVAAELGADLGQMQAASDRLGGLLRGLTPPQVDLFLDSQQGVFDGIDLLMEDDDLVDLLRFKTTATERQVAATHAAIKAVDVRLEYGICPRLPCFATFQGCNFRRLNRMTDYIQSKHYLWTGGRDGFRGTLVRYQQTLREWNPALDDARIEALMGRLLGVELPHDYRIADFDSPAPKSFFDEVVYRESRKMLFRIGDADRISPFVGLEHGGSPWMSAGELELLFQSMVDAGLTRFTYYTLNDITDEIWDVMTRYTSD